MAENDKKNDADAASADGADGDGRMPRQQRLAAALRENLTKRKAQARARRTPADGTPHAQVHPAPDGGSDDTLCENAEPAPSVK